MEQQIRFCTTGEGARQQREEAQTIVNLAEIGWGKDNPAFRQFFTTRFIPDGTADQFRWLNELQRVLHSPRIAAQFLRVFHQIDVTALAPRERQLLELIAQGRDNAQIAASLELTEKTVRNHITSIFAKLEVENRGQAIVLAREAGLGSRLR